MSTAIYDYQTKLFESKVAIPEEKWAEFYRGFFGQNIKISDRIPDDTEAQLKGIDRVITLGNGESFYIDEKIITRTYPHICLEYISNSERQKPGWLRRTDLKTDYIAYSIFPFDTCYFLNLKDLRVWAKSPRGKAICNFSGSRNARTNVGYGRHYTASFYTVPIDIMIREFGERIAVTLPLPTDDEIDNKTYNDIILNRTN